MIRILVEPFPDSIRQKDRDGWTPLHSAVCYVNACDIPSIHFLFETCHQTLKTIDSDGHSPLHMACACFDAKIAGRGETIIRFFVGACPEAAGLLDDRHKSPEHRIFNAGRIVPTSTVCLLLEASPDSARVLDLDNRTPLEHFRRFAGDGD